MLLLALSQDTERVVEYPGVCRHFGKLLAPMLLAPMLNLQRHVAWGLLGAGVQHQALLKC